MRSSIRSKDGKIIVKASSKSRLIAPPSRVQALSGDQPRLAALEVARDATRRLFMDEYVSNETADFVWVMPAGQATKPFYNRRGVEFFSLVRGDATFNGRALSIGEALRVDPGSIGQFKTNNGAEFTSHIFPFREVLCHKLFSPEVNRAFPLVSLIIIAKDIEGHVAHCIASCLLQTHSNIEVVVVVDKSDDNTLRVCLDFKKFDHRVTVLCCDQPLGANRARRAGLSKAVGDYCLILDGDDWISDDAIEKLIGVSKSQDADVVVFGFDHHSDRTRRMWDPVLPTSVIVSEGPLFYSKEPHWALGVSTLNHTVWMYFFAARIKYAAISSLIDVPLYEDLPFFLALIESSSKTAVANQVFYHYRRDRIGQVTQDWSGVQVGLKLSCLETAVNHALESIRSDHWFYQLILLYKIERIVSFERKACRLAGDVEGAIAWERYWLRLMAKFPDTLIPLITNKPTQRRFRTAKHPVIRALKFNRHARLLRKGRK